MLNGNIALNRCSKNTFVFIVKSVAFCDLFYDYR